MAVIKDIHTQQTNILPPIKIVPTTEPSTPITPSQVSATPMTHPTYALMSDLQMSGPVSTPEILYDLPMPPQGTMDATARIMQNRWTLNHTATLRLVCEFMSMGGQ